MNAENQGAYLPAAEANPLSIGPVDYPSVGDGERGSEDITFEVIEKIEGNKFVTCSIPVPENKPEGVGAKFIFASTIKGNEVGPLIFEQFLPLALAKKAYHTAPLPHVVGSGLDKVQEAYDLGKGGATSAKKLVGTL
ncbi:zinc-binding alcohol dehydrogenase domain-containing protein cipB [Diaporthe eres]|uniref:Uncharacterized protein n=1 Tax=Diaporthe vaccinii TaxID=105482 RepID=A0ABR4E1W5_9PEZI|nr:zinc-binding alcohol dehydrogenase domain-containing protein cipB [Diaporthe eres]